MATVTNPFDNIDLRVPASDWDYVRRFTSTFKPEDGSTPDPDKIPFRRYVDLWWAGMCVGIREGQQAEPSEWHTFSPGVVLSSDPWRITQLHLIAIATTDDPHVVNEPGKVIAIGNGFAATGVPILVDVMTGGGLPIWAVSDYFRDLATDASDRPQNGDSVSH